MKRKAIRSLIAILVIIGCLTSSMALVTAATESKAETNEPVADLAIKTSKDKNSYTTYLSKYSKSEYSTEDVIYELGGATLKKKPIEFTVNVEKDGLYYIGMSYKSLDTSLEDIIVSLKIDGKYLYSNMKELAFARMWCDKEGVNADALGNEYVPEQVIYDDYYYCETFDDALEATERFMVNLSEGEHTVTLTPKKGEIKID